MVTEEIARKIIVVIWIDVDHTESLISVKTLDRCKYFMSNPFGGI